MSKKKQVQNNERPSWDNYFIAQTKLVSSRATCDRKHVGAVLVKDNRIIATGYNGSIPGEPHCIDPEEFYECSRCGEKHLNYTDFKDARSIRHNFSCLGQPIYKRNGGHDMENGHCVRTIHAEVNAIAQAAKLGISTENCTLYCNTYPCWNCFKVIVAAGIKEVVYKDCYRPNERVENAAKTIPNFILRQYNEEE